MTEEGPLPSRAALRRDMLAWYDRHRRRLPWRAAPGARPDPYVVWLSEIMLQQTTVAAVGPYFERFRARWPSVEALAAAPLEEVLHAWAGLGYYARARNLHRCAREVAARHGGRFPDDEAGLRALPGIGAYTAAAVAAIAFDRACVPLDGNVERVMARLYGVATPLPAAKPELARFAAGFAGGARPGDFAQALMDLGATVCTPRRPACALCPLARACRARREGDPESLPARAPRPERPTRHGVAFWAVRADGAVLLRRRPPNGLLGGMVEVPSTEWRKRRWTTAQALRHAPCAADWRVLEGVVRHTFTHFHLELGLVAAVLPKGAAPPGLWCPPERLGEHALPSVMRKLARHAIAKA